MASRRRLPILVLCWAVALSGCGVSVSENEEQRRAREEKTREEAAKAAEKAKPALEEAGRKIGEAAHDVAEGARAAAQGAEEGWKRAGRRVLDLNSATEAELMELPGIGREKARKIIAARPYRTRHDLVTKGIVSEDEYARLRERIAVK